MKYYVVFSGKKTGIFDTWEECKEQVLCFKEASYKSFTYRTQAEKAFELHQSKQNTQQTYKRNAFAVDASLIHQREIAEYQGVDLETNKKVFKVKPFACESINIAEFFAIIHALKYLWERKIFDKVLYSDSVTAIAWIKKERINSSVYISKNLQERLNKALVWLRAEKPHEKINLELWQTKQWGENPADFGRK